MEYNKVAESIKVFLEGRIEGMMISLKEHPAFEESVVTWANAQIEAYSDTLETLELLMAGHDLTDILLDRIGKHINELGEK